jgi:hypothetical protein
MLRYSTTTVGMLFLLSNRSIIGAQYEDPQLKDQAVYPGFAIMQSSRFLDRTLKRALQIGLGIGTVPTYLRQHGIPTDVVEISEGTVEAAAVYFEYERCTASSTDQASCTNGKTVIMDGLVYLKRKMSVKPVYDLVIVDVYTGHNIIPFYTEETLWLLKESWLKTEGMTIRYTNMYINIHYPISIPHTIIIIVIMIIIIITSPPPLLTQYTRRCSCHELRRVLRWSIYGHRTRYSFDFPLCLSTRAFVSRNTCE